MRTVVLLISVLLVFPACSRKNKNQQTETPQKYPTMVVARQQATLESVYPATIKGQEDIAIQPRVEGFIEAIHVDEGSVVKKGQVLFKINSPQSEQSLASARAALNSAKAQLNTAEIDVGRFRPLAEKGIVSEVQLQTYENAYQSALAALKQAEATLADAQVTVGWTFVTSPVEGVVGSIPYRQGSLVNSSNILTTVANTDHVFAYFSLNEKDLMTFLQEAEGDTQEEKIGNLPEVTLVLADETVYPHKGRIETISGLVDVTTGSVNFRAGFDNKEGLLRSGSSGKIIIPKEMDQVFVVPQKATFSQQDKILLYKVQGDSVTQILVNAIPMPDGRNYVVTDGLNPGDRIVVDGVATLNEGKKIAIN